MRRIRLVSVASQISFFMVFPIRMCPTRRPRALSNIQIQKMGAEAGFYAEITARF